ncbi:response regulator receiver protein [Halorhabdus utahensis DSM 12940]|uniref:Response regulator receiver protein n=1 Tax=Halorhabdus utahensis (strain DSM 12940 / JCM 11049 / AX-2) TaxID=519442 RepID=C7NRA9_HALUD|nr:response regulator [Halorhabdus utahensis]ACV10546.1 response regulator receiver protein [Halorhabdus utahensis DSM 12940]
MTDGTERTTVLIVEDEQHLADLYAEYLPETYDVRTAYNGADALEILEEPIDIVLLDRRMPVMSGNEVLASIEERGIEVRVAMVTAVDPDFDIIDLGVDDYVVKPVSKDTLIGVVERLETVSAYNDQQKRLTAKKLKRNVLEVEKARPELEASERFSELEAEIDELEAEVQALETEITESTIER